MRITFVGATLVAAGVLAVEAAHSQACIGVPIPRASYGVQAKVGFGDESTTYGAAVTRNLGGPLSVGAGYGFKTTAEASNAHTFSGTLAFELPGLPLSICPLAGFRYFRVSDDGALASVTTSSFILPIGIGLAHEFPVSNNLTVTPYLTPQFLLRSSSGNSEDSQQHGPQQHGLSGSDTGFGLRKGAAVGTRRFFGGLDLELTSLEGAGTVYRVSFGVRF